MSVFKITMHTPSGLQSFECQDDEYILEAAEQAGYDMSYSCRAGACSSCVGKILNGTVDQSDQSFLDDDQVLISIMAGIKIDQIKELSNHA